MLGPVLALSRHESLSTPECTECRHRSDAARWQQTCLPGWWPSERPQSRRLWAPLPKVAVLWADEPELDRARFGRRRVFPVSPILVDEPPRAFPWPRRAGLSVPAGRCKFGRTQSAGDQNAHSRDELGKHYMVRPGDLRGRGADVGLPGELPQVAHLVRGHLGDHHADGAGSCCPC